MSKTTGFIVWICKKFSHEEIEKIIQGLITALKAPDSPVNCNKRFKEENPHYRDFHVDPKEPLTEKLRKKKETRNYTELLDDYESKHNEPLKPVNSKKKNL